MKRTQIKRRPLADSVLHSLEPEQQDYREKDSLGLYFLVKRTGTKSWNLRYRRPDGKWAWMGLGGFPAVSGKAARKKAQDLLAKAADGEDLKRHTRDPEKDTFGKLAEDWLQSQIDKGHSAPTIRQKRLYLDKDVLPAIGRKPIDQVTRGDCAEIQATLEKRGAHVMAGKVRRWLNQIYSRAIALGVCELNPASELRMLETGNHTETQHPHLLEPELPAFLRALRGSRSKYTTLIATWLLLRTASRPGMVRWAEWSEFDLDAGIWSISADKMKMSRPYSAPLSAQAINDLKELHQLTGRSKYLFPGYGSKTPVMSDNTINKALRMIGYKGKLVGHGARHTASTLLREHHWPEDWVEAQLAHKKDGVAGVYNKAQYIEPRREMMQWYADYLDALEKGSDKPRDPS